MEKALTPDEKIRRAEELYYLRKEKRIPKNEKADSVSVSKKQHILNKMIIQLILCFVLYSIFFVIKNYNFIFSKNVVDKANEILSYDINIQEIYCKIANYINNYSFEESSENKEEQIKEVSKVDDFVEPSTEVKETAIENLVVENSEKVEEKNLSQMEIDAKNIKEQYNPISPLKGVITSRYGAREQTTKTMSAYHLGLDIAANTGTVIVASIGGTVVYSGELGNYGKCIEIKKDDVLVVYGHCSKLYVKENDEISKGQQIAEVGQTGNATGPHLHFEVRKESRYVDPSLII